MKTLSKVLSTGISVLLLTTGGITTLAAESSTKVNNQNFTGSIDFKNSDDVMVSDVLSFDELVKEIAKDQGITVKEATNQMIASQPKNGTLAELYAATYRTLTKSFTVKSEYKPSLKFYCQTDEGSGSFRAIKKIKNVTMNRSYNGISKHFSGQVYTHLEDPNRIYYSVSGDFYNNGTTTGGGAVDINVGGAVTLNFNVSGSSNHYIYHYSNGYLRW